MATVDQILSPMKSIVSGSITALQKVHKSTGLSLRSQNEACTMNRNVQASKEPNVKYILNYPIKKTNKKLPLVTFLI